MRTSQDQAATAASPGDTAESFATWVRPHWDHMLRFAQRLVGDVAAEDVVQEALTAAWRSRRRFDPKRGNARAWLLTTVANKSKNHQSRIRLTTQLADVAAVDRDVNTSLDLSHVIEQLPQRQREAVALFYYLDLSTVECAQVMGCAEGTVKSTLSDARRSLGKMLGEGYA